MGRLVRRVRLCFAKLAKFLGGCWGKQGASNEAQPQLDNSDQDGSMSNGERERGIKDCKSSLTFGFVQNA